MKQQVTQFKQKSRQKEIILWLYKFRFLNRPQIQTLLKHKYFNRIIIWLNELTENELIRRYFNKKFAPASAVYSLGLNGRQYLKNSSENKNIKLPLLDRVWREHKFTLQFRNHCLSVADFYLSLVSRTQETKAKLNFYTQTDLYQMDYLILPTPDAYFSIFEANGSKKYYFLDIFNPFPERAELIARVKQYFTYYANMYWQDHANKPFPEIIFICPGDRSKNFLYKFIQKMLQDNPDLHFYLSTLDIIRIKGVSLETLQKVEPKNE